MEFLFILLGVVAAVVFLTWFGTHFSELEKHHLSSGKPIPGDWDLRLLSVDQLISDYTLEELDELADIATSHLKDDPKEVTLWEDFLRRVYMASDEKNGFSR